MFSILQDVRFGFRMLMKHRLATLVSIFALALGIGANTAMFSIAEAFLLHPAPFENADRIMALVDSRPQQNIDMNGVAPATYFDWRKEAHSFDQLAAYSWDEVNLTGDGRPEKVQAFQISSNLFVEALGWQLIELGQINVDHDLVAANQIDSPLAFTLAQSDEVSTTTRGSGWVLLASDHQSSKFGKSSPCPFIT